LKQTWWGIAVLFHCGISLERNREGRAIRWTESWKIKVQILIRFERERVEMKIEIRFISHKWSSFRVHELTILNTKCFMDL
jgi:hypothetical protein